MPDVLDGRLFTVSPNADGTKTLVAEISTLELAGAYPTIAIKSHRTGQVVRFTFAGRDYNGDDIAGWRYHPDIVDATCIPGAHRARVLIIND